jgi:glycosyltransferase involved in cell wall biosynthesis
MNLLILSEYFPDSQDSNITGGVEARCYNIAKRLAKKFNITLITSWRTDQKREDTFYGIKVIRVGGYHAYSNYAGFLSRFRFAQAAIKTGAAMKDIDLVEGYNFTTYYPAYAIAKKLRRPVIVTYHETWTGEWIKNKGLLTGIPYELFERFLLRLKFDKYICVSNFTKERLIQRGIPDKKTVVIPNGIDVGECRKASAKKYNHPTICYVGRLTETKKVDILIRAIQLIKNQIPDIQCKIIGKGPRQSFLKRLARDLKLSRNVEFLGFIENNKDVMKVIKSSHVLCLPSILEGFGMVIVEAMALGIPYVCADIPPLVETTRNGNGGLLFIPGNPTDLSKKIIQLINNKELYTKKQKEEKKTVKYYDWDNLSSETEKIYLQAVSR